MVKYEVLPTTTEHILELSRTIRDADRDEVWAISHLSPLVVLEASVARALMSYTGLADGKVLAIFGLGTVTMLSNITIPWMLTSNEIFSHTFVFLRYSKMWIEEIRKQYPLLVNYIDGRYIGAIKWARWLGFTIGPALPLGPDKVLFHRIEMRT